MLATFGWSSPTTTPETHRKRRRKQESGRCSRPNQCRARISHSRLRARWGPEKSRDGHCLQVQEAPFSPSLRLLRWNKPRHNARPSCNTTMPINNQSTLPCRPGSEAVRKVHSPLHRSKSYTMASLSSTNRFSPTAASMTYIQDTTERSLCLCSSTSGSRGNIRWVASTETISLTPKINTTPSPRDDGNAR